jgi:hypothetical protein
MKVELRRCGEVDPRLEYVLETVKKAVEVFVEAVKNMEYACRFKAFDILNVKKDEERDALINVLKEAVAIEIGNIAKDTLDDITYDYYVETTEESSIFWLSAKKEKPDYSNTEMESNVTENLKAIAEAENEIEVKQE